MSEDQPDGGFRGPVVCKIVGITYRQLDYWARTGLLAPSLSAETHGSGSRRLYSYQDIVRLRVIKQLLDAGLSLQQTRKAIDCLEGTLGEDLASANLVMAEGGVVLAETQEAVFDILRGGQGVFNVLPLSGVVEQVDAAIHQLPPTEGGTAGIAAV